MSSSPYMQQCIDVGLLVLRFALVPVFLAHGLQKVAMWKMQPNEQLKKPMLNIMRLLSVAEPLGALAMLGGIFTRLAAVGLGIVMLGAINLKVRVMKKKYAPTPDVGWEYELLIFMVCVAVALLGAGSISIDALLGLK